MSRVPTGIAISITTSPQILTRNAYYTTLNLPSGLYKNLEPVMTRPID